MSVTGKEDDRGKTSENDEEISSKLAPENGNDENKSEGEEEKELPTKTVNGKERVEGECSSVVPEPEFHHHSDLKNYQKKALLDLRSKLEESILLNELLTKNEFHKDTPDKGKAKVEEESAAAAVTDTTEMIRLWGVPLLPSKGDPRTDVLLLKFLRAHEFRPGDAFRMLKNTLAWRRANSMDSILTEDFGNEYDRVGFLRGRDREGRPVCYNVYGVFADEGMYDRTFGSEAGQDRFLKWRLQLLEKEIQTLDFGPGGASTVIQINDLKDAPGPSRRDLRHAMKRALAIFQDNYPEFVAKNIFVNVPFWYYAFNAVLSPFLTQRTKSKFEFSRPSRVSDTLIKYIAAEEIPVEYGGLSREEDVEFSAKDVVSEMVINAGATDIIQIPQLEVGKTWIWEVMIVGWDVSYKEEFVPRDEASYTVIVKKERRISWDEGSIRNSFTNKEAGKIVITIDNGIFKKKRVLYRYKIKN